jgi:hypothetical protein
MEKQPFALKTKKGKDIIIHAVNSSIANLKLQHEEKRQDLEGAAIWRRRRDLTKNHI